MKKKMNNKKKLVLSIVVCTLFFTVAFSSVMAAPPPGKIPNDDDWNTWDNEGNMFAMPDGNVGIGTTDPSEKLEVDGNIKATSYYGDGSSLTGVVITESDPVFTASAANGITLGDIINWNSAFGWGDHSIQNYLKIVAISDRLNGDGTIGSPLDLAQQGASDGQVMTWDDVAGAWIPGEDDSGPWYCSDESTVGDSLVGLWHMDEGSGDTVYDESSNNNDGTLMSGVAWTSSGKYGDALEFDGINDYAKVPGILETDMDALTLSAWVNFDTFSTTEKGHGIIAKNGYPDSTKSDFAFIVQGVSGNKDDSYFQFGGTEDGSTPCSFLVVSPKFSEFPSQFGFSIDTNTWYLATATCDRATTTAKIYINGVVVASDTSIPDLPIHGSDQPVWFGRGQAGHSSERRWMDGKIDEAAIWNRALSDSEVEDLYNNENNIYYNTGNVGIGTTSPSAKLQVQDGAVLYDGTTGGTPASGPGTRLMWIPSKSAFRAGSAYVDEWDDSNIGSYSMATGFGTKATGEYSTAVGYRTTASGKFSSAMGSGTTASGRWSTAMGDYTEAIGDYSTAMGYYTTASGHHSTAMGYYTDATGHSSTAMGSETTASGLRSTAMGRRITVDGKNSVGIGLQWHIPRWNVSDDNVMAILGGAVGIGTPSPAYSLDVEGHVQAHAYHTGDIFFQKDGQELWRMFEDENGLYLESLLTGKVFRFVLEDNDDPETLNQKVDDLQAQNEDLEARIAALEALIQ